MIGDETSVVDYGDVQGLVRFAHNRLTAAYYLLLRIADARSARAWLRSAAVTTAATVSPLPDTALQVAFTASGLRALGIPETVLVQFSDEFLSGMSGSQSRSRRLGDEGANAPQIGPGEPPSTSRISWWQSSLSLRRWTPAYDRFKRRSGTRHS